MGNISRFDQPAQSQFINTYSPIPFNEMVQAGQTMQKQYETGMDALQRVYDDTYNIKYIPGSKDEQYVKGQVIPAAKQVFEKYIQMDMGDPMVRRQAIMDLNSKIDKQKINKIQESQAGWMQHQQDKRKLALDNQLDPDEQDYGVGYDTDLAGVYNKQSSAYVDPVLEFRKTYTEPIKDSTLSESRDAYGNVRIKYGLDEKGLQSVVNTNIGNVRGSKLGDRLFRSYTRRYGIDPSSLNEQQRDEVLRKAMFEAGTPDLRQNVKYDRLAVPDTSGGRGSSDDQGTPAVSPGPMFSLAGTEDAEVPDVDEVTGAKKQGWLSRVIDNIKAEGNGDIHGAPTSMKSIIKIFTNSGDKGVREEDKTPLYKKVERQAINKYNYKGTDNKHKSKLVEDYIEDFYTRGRSMPVQELPTAKVAKENEDLFIKYNMAANREWYDPSKPLTADNKLQWSQVLEEYPQGEYQYSIIGGVSNNNPMFESGRQVGVYKVDDKGNPIKLEKTLYMGSDLNERSINSFANKFHSVNYDLSGEKNYTESIPGLGIPADISVNRKETPDSTKVSTSIKFNYKGANNTFKGDFNTTEEALGEFSKYVRNLNN